MPYKNPEDAKVAKKKYYEAHKPQFQAACKRHKALRHKNLGTLIKNAKDVPCRDCGIKYPFYIMHFDHVSGTKLGNISNSLKAGWTVNQTLQEIAKCEVVCANCHAERTYQRAEAERHKLIYTQS